MCGEGMSELGGGISSWAVEWQCNNEDSSKWEGEGPTWTADCPCGRRNVQVGGWKLQLGLWHGSVTMGIGKFILWVGRDAMKVPGK